ncbi:hypothetical protein VTN77DRAFT_7842 [Rasamsonia byssochlamydoides]|uniref:uncharacterized protein n=1 Tax=Rasamsonia byssochlamydoides TaxID=89139 RepID=UPI0037441EAA
MLSESFVASVLASSKTPASSTLKDVGICIHELQPASALRTTFKKSSTSPNGLAVTPTHVFAAQADKAVVHVYSRARGNQEATVPFPERIRSIAVAGGPNGEILVLGTEGGRLILWETCTGRQVSTSPAHLQPVTSLVVDPTSNFILSGSHDANVHVWSLPRLLAFSKPASTGRDQKPPNSPIRSFSNHRTAITALAVGHSSSRSNIAISAARDNTAVVWDYHTGNVLRTFLLPSTAVSITVDPADRAFYVGYESGNVQRVDFYENPSVQHPLYDTRLQSTPSQIAADDQWKAPSSEFGAATSLTLSYDGMTLLSGHQNGSILSWDIARGKYASTVADYTHPVTNLQMLSPSGFPQHLSQDSQFTIHNVTKPRYDQALSDASQSTGIVPPNYTFNVQLTSSSSSRPLISSSTENQSSKSDLFSEALTHPFFPTSLIEEGLAELAALDQGQATKASIPASATSNGDSVDSSAPIIQSLEVEIASLKKQLSTNEKARRATTDELIQLRSDLARLQDYTSELQLKHARSQREKVMARAKKEERDLERRKAWFDAERKGQNGDALLRKARAAEDNAAETSESGDMSDD